MEIKKSRVLSFVMVLWVYIHMAVVGSDIMIPPLYGDCDLSDIRRYKNVIRFILQVLSRK